MCALDFYPDHYLGILENIYVFEGVRAHRIVLVYDGHLDNANLYNQEIIQGDELGQPFRAVWKRQDEFGPGKPPVYPEGLIELLNS